MDEISPRNSKDVNVVIICVLKNTAGNGELIIAAIKLNGGVEVKPFVQLLRLIGYGALRGHEVVRSLVLPGRHGRATGDTGIGLEPRPEVIDYSARAGDERQPERKKRTVG